MKILTKWFSDRSKKRKYSRCPRSQENIDLAPASVGEYPKIFIYRRPQILAQ